MSSLLRNQVQIRGVEGALAGLSTIGSPSAASSYLWPKAGHPWAVREVLYHICGRPINWGVGWFTEEQIKGTEDNGLGQESNKCLWAFW